MRRSDTFIRAAKSLRDSKMRTILTSLAIAVGASTITLALAAGAAGREFIKQQETSRGLGDSAYIIAGVKLVSAEDEVEEFTIDPTEPVTTSEENVNFTDDTYLQPKDVEAIAAVPGVEKVFPVYSVEGQSIRLSDSTKEFVAPYLSVQIGNISPMRETFILAGSLPESLDGKVLLSADYARAFKLSNEELVGKEITLSVKSKTGAVKEFNYTVAAVTDDKAYQSDYMRIDHADAAPINAFQNGEKSGVYNTFVTSDGSVNINELASTITAKGYQAYTSETGNKEAMEAINIAQWGLVGFGVIALLAGIFGIINTQYISVLERTRQIGLMKAVGASKQDVSRLFRYEAAWVGLLGGLLGIGVAYGFSLTAPFLKDLLDIPQEMQLFIFEPLTLVIILAVLIIVAILSGYFPARKAARLDPIEALRTE